MRFTTSHPRDFVKPIIDAIDDNQALCNHVHLPVQSGSSRILERMRRSYTRDEYMRRIEWMKNARRDIAITTDIIVGFPGETEGDFEETVRLVEQVEYDAMFIFKYSRRPNTPAIEYEDHIPEEEKITAFHNAAGSPAHDSDAPECELCRRRSSRRMSKATTWRPDSGLDEPVSTKRSIFTIRLCPRPQRAARSSANILTCW